MDIYCKTQNTPECNELRNNINDCRSAGGQTMFDCVKEAEQKYIRSTDLFKDLVYPWKNFDWDYTRFIDNNYNARATGATSQGSIQALFANTGAMVKLAKGFIIDPNPNNNSSAANSDLALCDRVPAVNRRSCEVINRIKRSYINQPVPENNNSFFNKQLNGKKSSSFFYKWGTCKTKDNEINCKNKKHQWSNNVCYKPRFHFIKNEPGMDFTKLSDNVFTQLANQLSGSIQGNIPSTINDVLSFSPTQISSVYEQKPYGDYEPEPCPDDNTIEHFNCDNIADVIFRTVFATILLICCFLLLGFIYKNYSNE
jgi:hypothetical protein